MSWGVALRNGVAIGIGCVTSLLSGYADARVQNNIITETDDNIVLENGGLILLENS